MIKLKSNKTKMGVLLFILPALAIYLVFQIIPIIGSVYFSLVSWNGIAGSAPEFIGLQNYIYAFKSPDFILSLKNMAKMVIVSVIFHTPIALLMAVAINTKCKGYRLFKALFFVPTVFPLTAVGLMWYFIFMPTGSFNALLDVVGLSNLVTPWLVDSSTAMNTIVFVNIWAGVGYYMVIILAGLTTIPEDVYEAAAIDGATSVKQFFQITIPMLKPILSMCILMDIIGSVKVFDLVFAMTGGGPNGLTNLPTTLMYNEAFKYNHYGVGSAIGIIIMLICIVGTVGSNFITNRKKDI
ncbi:carbohydrate ABC transporter permease [Mediterraneibacter agrestimuris]|uniref:carbohydrate ABC transporter permease n=1 Tax=Mediterraneibacter agrestimuris TaxID=2941333 RepID=UPI0020423CF8|nr:sugar ABC transporter permease [Mediterraneibacter agrestimuris]